eukprot:gene2109-1286_t
MGYELSNRSSGEDKYGNNNAFELFVFVSVSEFV